MGIEDTINAKVYELPSRSAESELYEIFTKLAAIHLKKSKLTRISDYDFRSISGDVAAKLLIKAINGNIIISWNSLTRKIIKDCISGYFREIYKNANIDDALFDRKEYYDKNKFLMSEIFADLESRSQKYIAYVEGLLRSLNLGRKSFLINLAIRKMLGRNIFPSALSYNDLMLVNLIFALSLRRLSTYYNEDNLLEFFE